VGHYYQGIDTPYFDYDLHSIDALGEKLYRGPSVDFSKPYIACIGAAQTYGRFCAKPYAHLLSEMLGIQVLNLGVGGAGPVHFDTPEYVDVLNRAELVIFQVLSGRSSNNSAFNNSEHGGLEGVRIRDGEKMRFENFLEDYVKTEDENQVRKIVPETRSNYVRDYAGLMAKVNAPRLLFWFSDRQPEYSIDYKSTWSILNSYPQIIDRGTIDELLPRCDAYVECTSGRGLPQKLWPSDTNIDGAISKGGRLYNHYYPSPEMHEDAAVKLLAACMKFVPPAAPATLRSEAVRFVMIGSERTGTNLLSGLLDSHPDCTVGNEVFNRFYEDPREIPWDIFGDDERIRLNKIRSTNAFDFVNALYEGAFDRGYKVAGFKFMYGHAVEHADVRDRLLEDPDVKIIHVRRRNLFRRLVSERQALVSGVWAQDANTPKTAVPAVQIPINEMIWDFTEKERNIQFYNNVFENRNNVIEVHYEDISTRPQSVANRVARFLGLSVRDNLEIRFRKTGAESMRNAVSNHGDLKARLGTWLSFFDD
jgi:LPS sulfotransferase NodH